MASSQPPAVEYGAGEFFRVHDAWHHTPGHAVPHLKKLLTQAADEISALVLDPGYSVVRAGFAGEDAPKSVLPSHYGVPHGADAPSARYLFDDNAIHNPYADLDIRNPMASDGTVEDWDVAAKLWEYAITSRLTIPSTRKTSPLSEPGDTNDARDVEMVEEQERPLSEHPLLMAEPSHNPAKNREKSIEIAMEDWGAPAFYLARSGILAGFAAGRPSALVVDVGASTTSVTAMHDGIILKKATTKSDLAGNWVSEQLRIMFAQFQPPIALRPYYMIQSKAPVDAGALASFTLRKFGTPIRDSFRLLQEERLLGEFKETCVQIWNPLINHEQSLGNSEDFIKSQNQDRPFEFPDGANNVFGIERFKAAEGLFDVKSAFTDADHPAPNQNQTIQALCSTALNAVDVDLRATLLNNIVSTGGSSIIQGFNDRLHYEISSLYPGAQKVRIHSPGNLYERKFGPWIGGSILASLGSFHQLWISKKEYDEVGANIVEKRCK